MYLHTSELSPARETFETQIAHVRIVTCAGDTRNAFAHVRIVTCAGNLRKAFAQVRIVTCAGDPQPNSRTSELSRARVDFQQRSLTSELSYVRHVSKDSRYRQSCPDACGSNRRHYTTVTQLSRRLSCPTALETFDDISGETREACIPSFFLAFVVRQQQQQHRVLKSN